MANLPHPPLHGVQSEAPEGAMGPAEDAMALIAPAWLRAWILLCTVIVRSKLVGDCRLFSTMIQRAGEGEMPIDEIFTYLNAELFCKMSI